MPRRSTNETYLRTRRWLDASLSSLSPGEQSYSTVPIFALLLPFVLLELATDGVAPDVLWIVPIALLIIWIGFVGWRGLRLGKAAALKSARNYDREGKYLLPPEYADSESTSATTMRKRRALRRQRLSPRRGMTGS